MTRANGTLHMLLAQDPPCWNPDAQVNSNYDPAINCLKEQWLRAHRSMQEALRALACDLKTYRGW